MRSKVTSGILILLGAAVLPSVAGCSSQEAASGLSTTSKTTQAIVSPSLAETPRPTVSKTIDPSPLTPLQPTTMPDMAQTTDPTREPHAFQTIRSPDGSMVANSYSEYVHPSGIETIEILDADGINLRAIPSQLGNLPGDPRPMLSIYRWAPDSSALYFYYAFSYDGHATLTDGYDLQRMEIQTGEIETVIEWEALVAFAMSPDGTQLAYTQGTENPPRLRIRELTSGDEHEQAIAFQVPSPYQAGWIEWSPDGGELIFYAEHISDETARVMHLDLETWELRTLFDSWLGDYVFEEWTEENGLRFLHHLYPGSEVLQIDPRSEEVIVVGTVTPRP